MSADNYILVRKEGTWTSYGLGYIYVGYEESVSAEVPSYSRPVFSVSTLKDAILHAQSSETEYGYHVDLSLDSEEVGVYAP